MLKSPFVRQCNEPLINPVKIKRFSNKTPYTAGVASASLPLKLKHRCYKDPRGTFLNLYCRGDLLSRHH